MVIDGILMNMVICLTCGIICDGFTKNKVIDLIRICYFLKGVVELVIVKELIDRFFP